jgi:carbon-monoxide dehydrogenase large subunit
MRDRDHVAHALELDGVNARQRPLDTIRGFSRRREYVLSTSDHAHPFVPRLEDGPLLLGQGRFVDDPRPAGTVFAAFVRSPYAAANIRSVDASEASRQPGVVAVLTGADTRSIGNLARPRPVEGRGGAKMILSMWPALAEKRVVHVGQPVAMVVAATAAQAADAAERVEVDYEETPAVVDVRDADATGAPQVWPEAPGNLAVDWPGPAPDDGSNAREIERILGSASHRARVSLVNQRLVVASLETRGATASYDAAKDELTLRACSQGPGWLREMLTGAFGLPPEKLRVITEDVGGAFGMKSGAYPEYAAMLFAARKLDRPVHWMSSRSEAFMSDNQARDMILEGEMALGAGGEFLALRVKTLANLGAFITNAGLVTTTQNFGRCLSSVYRIPRIQCDVRCLYTNTVQTGPYRGAGRPEANYLVERLVDECARVCGVDRVEIRRRNLIAAEAMPYKTPVAVTYDTGEFAAIFGEALALADYAGFEKRRADAKRRGRARGIGISCFLEHAGGVPVESAALRFPGGDKAVVALGVQGTGQGHATVYSRLAAKQFGIDAKLIEVKQGDSRLGVPSGGTVASRSTMMAGSALYRTIETTIAKGKKAAARIFEATEADIEYRDGVFEVVGTDRRLSLFAIAAKAAGTEESLDSAAKVELPPTFPNGCHIAEVEIDPETGVAEVVAYTAVDDCGVVLDETLTEGQVCGGLAQGIGQALLEHGIYDRASGQILSGSFTDYSMPRADHMPPLAGAFHSVPCTTNPIGVKGVGEAGTTGALAAVMNAIADALPPGAKAPDMPATPDRLWRAFRGIA